MALAPPSASVATARGAAPDAGRQSAARAARAGPGRGAEGLPERARREGAGCLAPRPPVASAWSPRGASRRRARRRAAAPARRPRRSGTHAAPSASATAKQTAAQARSACDSGSGACRAVAAARFTGAAGADLIEKVAGAARARNDVVPPAVPQRPLDAHERLHRFWRQGVVGEARQERRMDVRRARARPERVLAQRAERREGPVRGDRALRVGQGVPVRGVTALQPGQSARAISRASGPSAPRAAAPRRARGPRPAPSGGLAAAEVRAPRAGGRRQAATAAASRVQLAALRGRRLLPRAWPGRRSPRRRGPRSPRAARAARPWPRCGRPRGRRDASAGSPPSTTLARQRASTAGSRTAPPRFRSGAATDVQLSFTAANAGTAAARALVEGAGLDALHARLVEAARRARARARPATRASSAAGFVHVARAREQVRGAAATVDGREQRQRG